MATIHIEKRKNAVWAWIVAILIIIALTWMYIDARKEKKSKETSSAISLIVKINPGDHIKLNKVIYQEYQKSSI